MTSRRKAGLFVTGTDTGVGKTLVSCALIAALRKSGRRVGAMKPIETGVGAGGPLDAIALRDATGSTVSLATICPQQFALPAAPNAAARAEGREVDLASIDAAYAKLSKARDLMLVEGAGGLLVPIRDDFTMAELAHRLDLPLLVVARASLGTINHTAMTLAVAASKKLSVLGVIISHADGPISAADASNLLALKDLLGDRLLGEVPPLAPNESPPPDALDIDALTQKIFARREPA